MAHPLLHQQAHRPWKTPDYPWVMTQAWNKLLFAHWALPPEQIRPLIPPSLQLDTFDGMAWIGVVPFYMTDIRFRGLFPFPFMAQFHELNVRTYVTVEGKPGVWFFSLDASNRIGVEGARRFFHLPYFKAKMNIRTQGETVEYESQRRDRRGGAGNLRVRYRPVGPVIDKPPGTLEHFLTERYCLYSVSRRGTLYRANIHHLPWAVQPAEAEFETNTAAAAFGIRLPEMSPLLHYHERMVMLAWYIERVRL
jgi:uncharacterized protein